MIAIEYYELNARQIFEQYESVGFEDVHGSLIPYLPEQPAKILDVGAGSGRDAAFLASKGYLVTAVEPSLQLLNMGKHAHKNKNIEWLQDELPSLSSVSRKKDKYEFILLSAVMIHLNSKDRKISIRNLIGKLAKRGRLVITLRYGPSDIRRGVYAVSEDDVEKSASTAGLTLLDKLYSGDALGRKDVNWCTLIFENQ